MQLRFSSMQVDVFALLRRRGNASLICAPRSTQAAILSRAIRPAQDRINGGGSGEPKNSTTTATAASRRTGGH